MAKVTITIDVDDLPNSGEAYEFQLSFRKKGASTHANTAMQNPSSTGNPSLQMMATQPSVQPAKKRLEDLL